MLREQNVDFDTILYLDTPPDAEQLGELLDALAIEPVEFVRKDKHFASLGLDEAKYGNGASRDDVISLLVEHPKLMQRPVALRDGRAVIGRPSERVLELVDD